MPYIEELYSEYNYNQGDVVFLGVANPKSDEYPKNADKEKEDIISFLEQNGYTFPTVFDETGEVYRKFQINVFPTTFIIGKDGNITGFIPGMLTKDIMKNVLDEAIKIGE